MPTSSLVRAAVMTFVLAMAAMPSQAQMTAEVNNVGPGCGTPVPQLIMSPPAVGGTVTVTFMTAFPNAHMWIHLSFGQPQSMPIVGTGCTVYFDLISSNSFLLVETFTDANGNWSGTFQIPNDPAFEGMQIVLQGRVWDTSGPLAGDLLSPGMSATFGSLLPGGEGCTPGYWKQPVHFADWPAPYTPSTMFGSVFADAFPGMTLLDVLEVEGLSDLDNLGRHAVAALLNAASPNVAYDLNEQEVIDMFNAVWNTAGAEGLKDTLDFLNQQGCPL